MAAMKRKESGDASGVEKGRPKKPKVDQSRQNGKNFKEGTTVKVFKRKDDSGGKSSRIGNEGPRAGGGKDLGKSAKFAKYPKLGDDANKGAEKAVLLSRKDRKELTEERKKARNTNYDMIRDAVAIWNKIIQKNVKAKERSELAAELFACIKGKVAEVAFSHTASRVVQALVKFGSESERAAVFEELRTHILELARNTYGHFIILRMLDRANKEQLQQIMNALHGHVVSLLRHPSGSAVVEHAFSTMATGKQKSELVAEFYAEEFRRFRGVETAGQGKLSDILSTAPPSKRAAILKHTFLALQPILEKGIVDHSILHRVLAEYLRAQPPKSMVEDIVENLSGPLLLRMVHTKDGAEVGAAVVTAGGAKERKKIVKALKGSVGKVLEDEYGNVVLLRLLDLTDDTTLVNKGIMPEILGANLKSLVLHKYARRVFLHLLAPLSSRYFPQIAISLLQPPRLPTPEEEAAAKARAEFFKAQFAEASGPQPTVPSSKQPESEGGEETEAVTVGAASGDGMEEAAGPSGEGEGEEKKKRKRGGVSIAEKKKAAEKEFVDDGPMVGASKKDPALRRLELLQGSGLAKELVATCAASAGEFLRSQWACDVIFEVARGGADGILHKVDGVSIDAVQQAIADEAAAPWPTKPEESTSGEEPEEHVLDQMFANRTIKKLVDGPPFEGGASARPFAAVLYEAIKGRCKQLATGKHSAKVVAALYHSVDEVTAKAVRKEVEPLLKSGGLESTKFLFERPSDGQPAAPAQSPEKLVTKEKSRKKKKLKA